MNAPPRGSATTDGHDRFVGFTGCPCRQCTPRSRIIAFTRAGDDRRKARYWPANYHNRRSGQDRRTTVDIHYETDYEYGYAYLAGRFGITSHDGCHIDGDCGLGMYQGA
jgi:hypothetical protein